MNTFGAEDPTTTNNSDTAEFTVQLGPANPTLPPANMVNWEPGELCIEERSVTLPSMADQQYVTLMLMVYQWWDGVRLRAPGVNPADLLPVEPIMLWGW